MKKIEAIIRKSRFEDVKKALLAADIEWFSYYNVRGEGKMRQARIYRGVMYDTSSIERASARTAFRSASSRRSPRAGQSSWTRHAPSSRRSTLSPGRPRKRAGICSSSARPRTRRSRPSRAIPLTRTSSRAPKRSKPGSRSARSGAICRFVWFHRRQGRKNCGNHAGKLQKKCVQIAKYLIQYAELRKCGRKKQLFFQRVVMRWSLSGTQEAPIRGGLP